MYYVVFVCVFIIKVFNGWFYGIGSVVVIIWSVWISFLCVWWFERIGGVGELGSCVEIEVKVMIVWCG